MGHYTAVKRYAQEVALTYGPVSGEGESGAEKKTPDLLGALEASFDAAKAHRKATNDDD
jgi:hypothetical protein